MKHFLNSLFVLSIPVFLASSPVQAGDQEKMIIALKSPDFELTETDISSLAVGEAKTIETESGKVIDILRTADGAEIYVDGQLIEMNLDDIGEHEKHIVKKHVEVVCESEVDCEENVMILSRDGHHGLDLAGGHGDKILIHKEVELVCTDDEEGTSCGEESIWVSEGGDVDLEALHEMHEHSEGHKVIVIKKKSIGED
jgi:hypothetical protein